MAQALIINAAFHGCTIIAHAPVDVLDDGYYVGLEPTVVT